MSCCTNIEALSARICGLSIDDVEGTVKYKIKIIHHSTSNTSTSAITDNSTNTTTTDKPDDDGDDDELHSWTLIKRYSDFDALHKKLVESHGIPLHGSTSFNLPPKRIIGNKDPDFIESRRIALNSYLASILCFFKLNPPEELIKFLEVSDYEILYLLKRLAIDIFENGDALLVNGAAKTFSPYQIYAINQRLKMPIPSLADSLDKRQDFSHILDFASRTTCLNLIGSNIPLGSSTIIPNHYPMSLNAFKSCTKLKLKQIQVAQISEFGPVRSTVESLMAINCDLSSISQLLLADSIYKSYSDVIGLNYTWPRLSTLNLANNKLRSVDDLGSLAPALKTLDLSFNGLESLYNTTDCVYLESISYAGNKIQNLQGLHLLFGQIARIDLSANALTSLAAFSSLYSLIELNTSCNRVEDVEEVQHLGALPCLEVLYLTGNPVASSIDYRVRALTWFGTRAAEITLDNEKATGAELDQIRILQAINAARNVTIK